MAAADANAAQAQKKNKPLVLVVDDEKDLLDLIAYNLQRNGYSVITADNGDSALTMAMREKPNLILLDLMLPGLSGTEVARRLRAEKSTARTPIIMLTAKSEETDVVVGLTLGADDYVTKPFSTPVLLARMASALRRSEVKDPLDQDVMKIGPVTIDGVKHAVMVDDAVIDLTLTEFRLLSALVAARGRVLTRDQLMDKAMGEGVFVTDRAIDVHITGIRKKLGEAGWVIRTVRGVGYGVRESAEHDE